MSNINTSVPTANGPGAKAVGSFRGPFAIMTVLFFMWGFMTVWNDILIPQFKEAFTLTYFEAMLVQFAFFGAYAVGGLVYYLVSMVSGDPINRIGYKNGVILGLIIAAVGSALFYPAATAASYPFFLVALFVVGLGFAMLQIAANPYVTILGPERTASSRLNLSQGFNSFGTTIGPIIAGWLIFSVFMRAGTHGADSVKMPYLGFAAVFLMLAVFFKLAHLPDFTNTDRIEEGGGALKHHILFTQYQAPVASNVPTNIAGNFINKYFKSFDNFKDVFEKEAMKIQGSGWVYLSSSGTIKTIKNHDIKMDIVLLVDWWEHAWVLDYQADKKRYLSNQWTIINWNIVGSRVGLAF